MKRVIQFIVFALLISAFIYLGSKEYREKVKNNKSVTSNDVLIDGDTLFVKANHSKILSKLSSDSTFILYTCTNTNKLCPKYGMLINEIAKNYNIDDLYYYDIEDDRLNNNGTYQKIVSKLKPYLLTDDNNKQDLHAPSVYFIKNGKVYSFDDSLAFNRGKQSLDTLWSDKVKEEKREYLISVMEGYILNE